MKKRQNQSGFTLIELLIVIAIIGILASFLLANFLGVKLRARDAQRKSDIRQIQTALELYRSDNSAYPNAIYPNGCSGTLSANSITYMQSVPCDPLTKSTAYTYVAGGTGSTYTLTACLENTNDQDSNGVSCTTANNGQGKQFSVTNP